MQTNRRRLIGLLALSFATLGGGAAATLLSASPTQAQDNASNARPVSLPVFRGDLAGANIQLGAWGSGMAEASKEAVLVGTNSVKVTTVGLYQGARMDFGSPVDLGEAFRNPYTYLRFQLRFSGQGSSTAGFDPNSGQTQTRAASPFRRMRYLLTMADGTQHELIRPIELPPSEDPDSWVPVAFPLSAVLKKNGGKVPTGDGARLKQLAVFGDRYAQFLIGEINVITDQTEINVAPLDDIIAFALQPTVFVGSAEGGASTLKYSWDFDASDGIQEDATGRATYNFYPRTTDGSGQKTYKVTLTVSDVDGIKKPQSVSMDLQVSD